MSNPLVAAIINTVLDNKEKIINKMVDVAEQLFHNLLKKIRRFSNGIFPGIIPPLIEKSKKLDTTSDVNASSGASQRRSDNIHQHGSRAPQALSKSHSDNAMDEEDEGEEKPLFVMPIIDKPISYNDIVLAQRLFYDSIDAYNAWQESQIEDDSD